MGERRVFRFRVDLDGANDEFSYVIVVIVSSAPLDSEKRKRYNKRKSVFLNAYRRKRAVRNVLKTLFYLYYLRRSARPDAREPAVDYRVRNGSDYRRRANRREREVARPSDRFVT